MEEGCGRVWDQARFWGISLGIGLCMALLAEGCTFEDRPRTVVSEIRVVAAQLSPPEVVFTQEMLTDPDALAELVRLEAKALIVDPAHPDESLDVSAVACTQIEGICLETLQYQLLGAPWVDLDGVLTEAAWRDYLTRHAWRGRVDLDGPSGEVAFDIDTFEGWPWYLQQLGLSEYDPRMIVFACLPDACPAFEARDAYLANPAATGGAEVLAGLALIAPATDGLALESYSFSRKSYKVSLGAPVDPNHNPEIQAILIDGERATVEDPAQLRDAQTVTVRIEPWAFEEIYGSSGLLGIEALTVSLLSTSGTVAPNVLQVSYTIGEVQVSWETPEGQDERLWAVVRDSRGGMGWMEIRAVR